MSTFFLYVCKIQMSRFGFYVDYKMENQHAWLFCGVLIIIGIILTATTFYNTYNYYMESNSVLNMIKYISSSLHQSQMLTAPALTYVYLLHNLQKRYAVLNQLMRYCFEEEEKKYDFVLIANLLLCFVYFSQSEIAFSMEIKYICRLIMAKGIRLKRLNLLDVIIAI